MKIPVKHISNVERVAVEMLCSHRTTFSDEITIGERPHIAVLVCRGCGDILDASDRSLIFNSDEYDDKYGYIYEND